MLWTDELGRARYYLTQANSLFLRAQQDFALDEISTALADLTIALKCNEQHTHNIPNDSRTALHQCSLALVNVRGSLIADSKIKEANMANEIRGLIIHWFEWHQE